MFKKFLTQILQSLGLVDKAKNNELTCEDWAKVEAAFSEQFGKTMAQVMAESQASDLQESERAAALAALNSSATATATSENAEPQTTSELVAAMTTVLTAQTEAMQRMAATAVPDNPAGTVARALTPHGAGHTDTHLFGIEHPMFSMESRCNQIARTPNIALISAPTREDSRAFEVATRDYGASLAAQYRHLKENNQLELLKQSSSNGRFTNDLSQLGNAGLGDQYVVLRQNALIARILEIPTVYHLFPRRYGIQDRELMTIAYFDELSQAYQPGPVFKGAMKLQPEMGYVDDSMFKTEFGPLKEIERQYIGYLNTDGSDPMKWSMIEWQLLNMYKILVNEQNMRVIRGCYVKPETGVAGSFLNAGTGLLYTLQRYRHEHKLLPHSDDSYNDYSEATMLEAVTQFVKDVMNTLDENATLDNKFLYLNKRHQSWWTQCIRAQFGKETDFTGPDSYANVVPDLGVRIKWVPNLANLKFMFIQEHGNMQALEFIPGEMLAVDFDRAMEMQHVWSTWKEGFSGYIIGKAFNSRAELLANNYSMQTVFMNMPATSLAAGATTADADKNYWFISGANGATTALTDITKAKTGVVYIIETGAATNATSIAKAGKFADITEAWTPTAEGDYIMVVLKKSGIFMELERCVGGNRTINVDAQPNIIGGRK